MRQAEFELLAACCSWPMDDARARQVQIAASGNIDWERFQRLARRHRVEAMSFRSLMRAGTHLSAANCDTLKNAAAATLGQNLRLAGESARLRELFEVADIQVIFLKGCSLAMLAYCSLALKHGKDIDVLVARVDAQRALVLLQKEGYRNLWVNDFGPDRECDIDFFGRDVSLSCNGIEVELHWQLSDNPFLLHGVDMSSAKQSVLLYGDASVSTLADKELFLYLSTHGATHAWFRLKWLADINAFLSGRSGSTVTDFYESARRNGDEICAGLALLLCKNLFGLEIPSSLAFVHRPGLRLRLLRAFAMRMLAGPFAECEPYDRPFGTTQITLSQFLLGRGWKFLVAQCGIALTSKHDRLRYKLPASLRFLYLVIRLPLWISRRICWYAGWCP